MLFRKRRLHVGVTAPRVYTCDEVGPEQRALGDATARNFQAALAAKGLTSKDLFAIEVPPMGSVSLPGPQTPEELDKIVGFSAKAGEIHPYTFNDKQVFVYVGEAAEYERAPLSEFAVDAKGDIWHVVRAPHARIVRAVQTTGCQWGCWGSPPSGEAPPQWLHRNLWVLPVGASFRGDVTIEYDAPALDEHPMQQCGLPG